MEKKIIIAAGGLVTNEKNELLMIFRRGFWDLPKGKLDAGETIEHCAVREVEEETGVNDVKLAGLIGKTYHEYFDKWIGEDVMKETWWYEMAVKGNPALVPQTEEDIEQIVWAKEIDLKKYLADSYPNIVEIIGKWRK